MASDYSERGLDRQMRVKLFVKEDYEPSRTCEIEVPIGCDFKPLHDTVSDTILGGESERWTLLKETRTPRLGPDGGGHIEVAQEWQSRSAALFSHPAEDCAPVTSVGPDDLRGGADVYAVMLGQVAKAPINSSQDLARWWASQPRPGPPLLAACCRRLLAKLRVAPDPAHVPPPAAARLVAEGLAGLRELATDRWYGSRLPTELLDQGLMAALRWEKHAPAGKPAVLAGVLEAASAATWALALYGGPRAALVSSGVVKELVAALAKAQAWRTVALARGGAAADAAVAAQQREAAAAQEELDTAAAAAAKAEEEEAGKRSDGPDLDAAVAAADAAADAALRQPLPDVTSISLSDCYAPPAGEVSFSTANRLAYNCLGALGVLAVDSKARAAFLEADPQLTFLITAASTDFPCLAEVQHDLDVAAWLRRQTRRAAADGAAAERRRCRREQRAERRRRAAEEARERAEREAAEAAAAAELEAELAREAEAMAAEDPELAALMANRNRSRTPTPPPAGKSPTPPPGPGDDDEAERAGKADREGDEQEQEEEEEEPESEAEPPPPDPYPLRDPVPTEEDPRIQQVMAAEALYSMLGRERGVRRTFAAAGGLAALQPLLLSPNDGVVVAAVSALAAYGRDVGHDHTSGVDMVATAAPPPPPPPPPEAAKTQSLGPGAAPRRSLAPAAAAAAPAPPKRDPVIENAGAVAAALVATLPPVLEGMLVRYSSGAREVGGVMPGGPPAPPPPEVPEPLTAQPSRATTFATVGGRSVRYAISRMDSGATSIATGVNGAARAYSPVGAASTRAGAAAAPPPLARTVTIAPRHAESPQALSTMPSTRSQYTYLGAGASVPSDDADAAAVATGLRGCFTSHKLAYVIEMTSTALWAAVSAELRAAEIKAAAVAAAKVAAEAEAAAAAAAAAAPPPPAQRLSSSSGFSESLLGNIGSPATVPGLNLGGGGAATAAARPSPTASPAPGAAPGGGGAVGPDADAGDATSLTPALLQHIAQLAVAAAKLVSTELIEMQAAQRGEAAGGTASGSRHATQQSRTGRTVGGGMVDGDATADGGATTRGSSSGSHSHILGSLHSLLGCLCIVQGNNRLVRNEFKSLLARHATLRRLHTQKELAEEEMQVLLDEMELARKQPGRFFFEEEEEAKREEKRNKIRQIEAEMRKQLRAIAAAEDALQDSADSAVHAVEETLALLPYGSDLRGGSHGGYGGSSAVGGPGTSTAKSVGGGTAAPQSRQATDAGGLGDDGEEEGEEAPPPMPHPLPPPLEAQLGHCHLLAAGVIQAMAATLQPGAVDAAFAAAAQLQSSWEAETSVSAAAEAADAADAAAAANGGDTPSAEALAAATAAAALYQGPYREAILGSGVMEKLLAAAAARYTAASSVQHGSYHAGPAGVPPSAAHLSATGSGGTGGPGSTGLASRASRAPSITSSLSRRMSGEGPGLPPPPPPPASMGVASEVRGNAGGGGTGPGTGPGSGATVGGGVAGGSPTRVRVMSAGTQQVDNATAILMQVTSCALMHLASTECALEPHQLAAALTFMRAAAHHAPCAPYIAAALYSLARHVPNRRGMVEGLEPPPPQPSGLRGASGGGGGGAGAGAGGTSSGGVADGKQRHGSVAGAAPGAQSPTGGAKRAGGAPAPPPAVLGKEVWVEVLGSLLRNVLLRIRKTGQQPRLSVAEVLGLGGMPPAAAAAVGSFSSLGANPFITGASNAAAATGVSAGPVPTPSAPLGHHASPFAHTPTFTAGAALGGGAFAHGPGLAGPAGVGNINAGPSVSSLRSARFLVMASWLLLRQWLVDKINPVNLMTSAEGVYARGGMSWWTVRFDADTPLELSGEVMEALGLVVEAAAAEGRVAIPSPRCAKALSVIATSEHKRRGQMEAEEKLDTGNVLRHALRAHASNMASHVDMIAGMGPTQRQLPRTSSARVQYEDIAVAAALDEYELDEGEEEGEQEGAATGGIFITGGSCVPAHQQLPGATAAPAVATATYDDYDEDDEGVPQQPQQQQHASSAWASARREPVGPPHNSRTTAMAAAPARTGPPAWDGPAAAASSAVPASSGDSDAGSSASGRVGFKLHLPRTDQLLRKLKIFNAHRGGHGGANSSRASNSAIGAITTADGVGSEGQPSPPRRLATTGSIDSSSNENSSSSNVQADGFGRTVSPPKGSQYGTATPPPSGYLSMPPSASPTSRLSWMASTAANAAAPSPPPSRHLQQQELAALARARGSGGAADADAAAVSPTRSAGSFTADMGGCRRPSLTQLFPESDTAGGGGALSGLMGDLGRGLSRELLYATGEDGTAAGGVAAMQCSARHSFSNQALVRQPGQRRGSMVVLPSSGMCGGAGGINPASQGLRPTMARANMARLARRSVTCLEDYPYAAVPMDAPAAGADAGASFAVGASVPVSPVSPAVKSPGAGDSGSGRAHLGFRAAAEALFNKVTRSPARGAAAAGQEWYPGADVSPGQPPLSPSTLRFASATVGSAGGAGAASPFATAAAGASVYRRAGSSGLASPIASPGTSSATNLFAGMITAAGGANGAPSSGGGGSAGGSATTSARARVAPPNPLQVAATQSGEAWFVGRTASAMQQASASASSSSRRLLPTPSSQAAAPISGGSSFISSVAANPNTGGSAVPRLTPAVLQPRAASTNTSPLPVLPPGSSVPLGVGQGRAAGNGGPGFGERMHALSP